jgi:alpha-D-ribose 1-methylphosphonate 5-triphosphate synthase subunit PhnG
MNMPSMTRDDIPDDLRPRWISSLSLAEPAVLEAQWGQLDPKPSFRWLRPAESGLVMLRGRAGGNGQAFNLGEMTATRAVALVDGSPAVTGYGYVAGRSKRHAELAALFDALLQDPARREDLWRDLILPVEAIRAEARRKRAAAVGATRVDFTTMVRGDD